MIRADASVWARMQMPGWHLLESVDIEELLKDVGSLVMVILE